MDNRRSGVLKSALKLINDDRENTYGAPEDNLGLTARFWGLWLGIRLEAHDVATLMELSKIARRKNQPTFKDNYTDAAGYAALGYELANDKKQVQGNAEKEGYRPE
jgi:hypothetical protein